MLGTIQDGGSLMFLLLQDFFMNNVHNRHFSIRKIVVWGSKYVIAVLSFIANVLKEIGGIPEEDRAVLSSATG